MVILKNCVLMTVGHSSLKTAQSVLVPVRDLPEGSFLREYRDEAARVYCAKTGLPLEEVMVFDYTFFNELPILSDLVT